MNKARNEYLYELVGIIRERKIKKIKDRECFDLSVELTNYPEVSIIKSFRDKLKNQQIWTDLNNKKFLDKKYLFYCQNWMGQYRLINWKDLSKSSSEREKELKNHGNN
ncbi:MAG: hypothetical protein mread185_000275 [Mycoplasmataceae bacterium]|nr:MAG: hypothetical protein mread185_000275 [Mycoplasmataceae bacterium]